MRSLNIKRLNIKGSVMSFSQVLQTRSVLKLFERTVYFCFMLCWISICSLDYLDYLDIQNEKRE